MEELCRRTPYNLKKDLKNIDEQTRQEIAEELANEIYLGLDRPPTAVSLHWGRKRQATCAKIRVVDVRRDAGKSNGYRCIVLVDYVHSSAFLLHIYRHAHGEAENISRSDRNQLDGLVDEYERILKANTVAIMFPYIRSQISLLTTQPGLHPVMLPPMNINALLDSTEEA